MRDDGASSFSHSPVPAPPGTEVRTWDVAMAHLLARVLDVLQVAEVYHLGLRLLDLRVDARGAATGLSAEKSA